MARPAGGVAWHGWGLRLAVLQNGVEQRKNVEPYVPFGTPIVPVVVDVPVSRTAPGKVEEGGRGHRAE